MYRAVALPHLFDELAVSYERAQIDGVTAEAKRLGVGRVGLLATYAGLATAPTRQLVIDRVRSSTKDVRPGKRKSS